MPRLKHKTAKLYRKVRLSASVDIDAYNILARIVEQEKRSLSNALNLILYEAGASRGIKPTRAPMPLPPLQAGEKP